jgi:hypothetical protein
MGCGSSKAKRQTALVGGEGGALVLVDVDTVNSGANRYVDNNTISANNNDHHPDQRAGDVNGVGEEAGPADGSGPFTVSTAADVSSGPALADANDSASTTLRRSTCIAFKRRER